MKTKTAIPVTEITFWKDNKIDQEYKVGIESIIRHFVKSDHFQYYEQGAMLERCLLNHMTSYGSFDRLPDEAWQALEAEFKKQS
jgi:hypothetical protein